MISFQFFSALCTSSTGNEPWNSRLRQAISACRRLHKLIGSGSCPRQRSHSFPRLGILGRPQLARSFVTHLTAAENERRNSSRRNTPVRC